MSIIFFNKTYRQKICIQRYTDVCSNVVEMKFFQIRIKYGIKMINLFKWFAFIMYEMFHEKSAEKLKHNYFDIEKVLF